MQALAIVMVLVESLVITKGVIPLRMRIHHVEGGGVEVSGDLDATKVPYNGKTRARLN